MKKILIIEDDQLVANIYRNKFSVENYQVEVALDGETGYDLIGVFQPDVIILDLMLPKISGLDLLKKIRAQENLKLLPIIVFSNTYLSNMVQEAWKAGATKCLSKANCTPKQVIEVLRGLLLQAPVPALAGASGAPAAPAVSNVNPSAVPPHAAVSEEEEMVFEKGLRHSFLAGLPEVLSACRLLLQSVAKSSEEPARVKNLEALFKRLHNLASNAGVAGVIQVAQMADALEALLKELYEKPKNINSSTLRTVASGIDFLGLLFEKAPFLDSPQGQLPAKPNILVVDDEAISRRAVTYALEKAKLPSVSVESPQIALEMLGSTHYDLVFLDVDMPGMNGFELCTKLRALQRNKTTPVIFVTGLTDFESRANSTMSGGNDLIAKPFLFMELAVKAMIYILRGRLNAISK